MPDPIEEVSLAVDRLITAAVAVGETKRYISAANPNDARTWKAVSVTRAKLAQAQKSVGANFAAVLRHLRDVERELVEADPRTSGGTIFDPPAYRGFSQTGAVKLAKSLKPEEARAKIDRFHEAPAANPGMREAIRTALAEAGWLPVGEAASKVA